MFKTDVQGKPHWKGDIWGNSGTAQTQGTTLPRKLRECHWCPCGEQGEQNGQNSRKHTTKHRWIGRNSSRSLCKLSTDFRTQGDLLSEDGREVSEVKTKESHRTATQQNERVNAHGKHGSIKGTFEVRSVSMVLCSSEFNQRSATEAERWSYQGFGFAKEVLK